MFSTRTTAGIAAASDAEEQWMATAPSQSPESYAVAVAADAVVDIPTGAIGTGTVPAVATTGITATNPSASSGSLDAHGPSEATAAAAAIPFDSKTTTSSPSRRYRILVLSALALALVFGTGFGLGVLYSNNQCKCHGTRNSSSVSSNDPFTENSGVSLCNDASDPSTTADSEGSSTNDGTSRQPPPVQQAEDSTVLPPNVYALSTMCPARDDALHELRQAARVYANSFINEFAHYIRKGGNNTEFADTHGSYYADGVGSGYGEPWNALDWATAVTAGATETITETRDRGSRQTQASVIRAASRSQWPHRPTSQQAARSATLPPKVISPPSESERTTAFVRPSSSHMQRRAQSRRNATTATVQVADTVKSYGAYVYVVHDDEIVVVQSATTAIHSRIRIPKVHSETHIVDLLLLLVPKEDSEDDDEGTVLVPHLVALVNEWTQDYAADNTTVLVYQHGGGVNSEQQQQQHEQPLTLVQRYSLPGMYSRAYAVSNKFVHVVTSVEWDWQAFTTNLTPAVLQMNETNGAGSDDDMVFPGESPLLLNETRYRQLAAGQLERQLEAFVQEQTATWDCTGFVPLLPIRPNNTNWDLAEFTQFLYITSLDVSADSGGSNTMSTVSVMPPGRNYHANMLVTDNKFVLWYQLWSGNTISLTSRPLTWFIVFSLVNASAVLDSEASSSSAVVPGTLLEYTNNPVDVNHYSIQSSGHGYLRFMTTRYDNLLDFYEWHNSNDFIRAARGAVVTLKLTDDSAANNGAQASSIVVGGELTDIFGINDTITSVTYHGDYMLVVGSPVRNVTTGEVVGSNDASFIIYTIDTANPSKPRPGAGGQELALPAGFDELYLYPIDDSWMIGIGVSNSIYTYEPFQLLLLNVSNLDEQPPRLVHQWQDDDNTAVSSHNDTSINDQEYSTDSTASTDTNNNITQVISNAPEYNGGTPLFFIPTVHFIDEGGSNMLVLPVQSTRFLTRPCIVDNDFSYWQPDDDMNHNSSFYNATCRYDDWVVFDGFWIFHIDLDDINNAITKHFVIDHASPDLQQQSEFCINTILLQVRSLAFNGDVMTFKHNVILSHDVQTQVEAAPPLILTPSNPADCNS